MAKAPSVISHWYSSLDNFQTSALNFYSSVEQAIARRQIPDLKISRVDWREGGVFSAKREYLRVRRKEFVFDICAAPFGTGFFFSWWWGEMPSGFWGLVFAIPFAGPVLLHLFHRMTYYRLDTAYMFQESVRLAVNECIDALTTAKGIRALSELERKPILKALAAGR